MRPSRDRDYTFFIYGLLDYQIKTLSLYRPNMILLRIAKKEKYFHFALESNLIIKTRST